MAQSIDGFVLCQFWNTRWSKKEYKNKQSSI